MRTNLRVPFAEKDDAKRLGAKWDPARKVWYIEDKADISPFSRWLPSQDATAGTGEPSPKPLPARKQQTSGTTIVGNKFVAQARICNCLPCEACDTCQSSAFADR